MSAQFEKGDFSIEPEPNTRLVDAIGHKWHRTEGCRRWHNDSVRRSECLTWVDLREHHGPLTMADGSTIPATEPEDKADLYVEPEPLKGAGPAFNDGDVHHLKVISGSTTVFDGLAVFEEADNGNINVTPVPRCTSLGEKAGSILRCGRHEGHSDGHWTVGSTPAAAWSDERAYGRVVEGGAS